MTVLLLALFAVQPILQFFGIGLLAFRLAGMNVVTRVMGLLIVAIAVEFMAKGLTELFPVLARAI